MVLAEQLRTVKSNVEMNLYCVLSKFICKFRPNQDSFRKMLYSEYKSTSETAEKIDSL